MAGAKLLHQIKLKEARTGTLVDGAEALKGKVVGVVIAPHWLPMPLRHSLSSFSEHIDQLKDNGKPVAFVYVAVDREEGVISRIKATGQAEILDERPDLECFDDLSKQLPEGWFVVPLEDSAARSELIKDLRAGMFSMAFVNENGEVNTKEGMEVLMKWGADGFPYTSQRIEELKKEAAERAANQSLKSLLLTADRDYVVRNDGSQVKIESLEGKVVALYFSAHWCGPCRRFTPTLADFYKKIKDRNEEFEIVFVSADKDEAEYEEYFKEMPWLAIPFSDTKTRKALDRHFDVEGIPTLVVLDKNGKTVSTEAVELVYKHGVDAYPFTPERMAELKAEEEARKARQSLESLLVTENRSFVLSNDSKQVEISGLKGKTVGLYFSAHWCPPCRDFTPRLASVYKKLKEQTADFEIIFISSDRDEESFKSYHDSMPWLALPFSDRQTKSALSSYFEVRGIPSLIILGPDGRTVTENGRSLVMKYGVKAYPFTDEHISRLEEKLNADIAKLPKEVKHPSHPEHPLVLVQDAYSGRSYGCDICEEDGSGWVYHCDACSYDAHPFCAQTESEQPAVQGAETEGKEGWVCEGGVCKKA